MTRRSGSIAVGFALAAGLLVLLLRHADVAVLLAQASRLSPWFWALVIAGLLASYALRALRLQIEWGPRIGVRFTDCLDLMLVHNAAVNVLPLRAGEAGYPWLLHRRFGVPLLEAATSLLRLRLQDLLVLVLLSIAVFMPGGRSLALALAVVAASGCLVFRGRLRAWASARADDGRLAAGLRGVVRATTGAPSSPGASAASWACAASNWTVKLLAVGALLAGLAGLGASSGLRGALGGELAAVLPLQGPAGFGSYEGAVWAAVATADSTALRQLGAAALSVHVFSLAVGLLAAAGVHGVSVRARSIGAQGGTP